jgi:antirestriction protein ArdC
LRYGVPESVSKGIVAEVKNGPLPWGRPISSISPDE